MRRVIFPIVKSGATIVYPDDIEFFANTEDLGNGYMAADYTGADETLTDYTAIDTINVILSISGGDNQSPPGILNNGTENVTITIACQLPDGTPAPLPDSNYRVSIRDSVGAEYDIISIPFVGGEASFAYTSDMRPATIHIDVDDLSVPGMDVDFNIIGDNLIKIYRAVS